MKLRIFTLWLLVTIFSVISILGLAFAASEGDGGVGLIASLFLTVDYLFIYELYYTRKDYKRGRRISKRQ